MYGEGEKAYENIEGYLFLITSSFYILYDNQDKQYIEIPIEKVAKIQYSVNQASPLTVLENIRNPDSKKVR